MGLSRRHLSEHKEPLSFDVNAFADALRNACPEVLFAFLLGSSANGQVDLGADVDVALFVEGDYSLDLYSRASGIIEDFAPGAHPDVGILNKAEPVYQFEALKGKLLFARDHESYLQFFSLTCRTYESQLASYERQHAYRKEAT